VDNPDVFADPETFLPALVQALVNRDSAKLQQWMTGPFLTGTWRADLSETSPADALKALFDEQLAAEPRLTLIKDADLAALMGGKDPLSIPRQDAGVMYAALVSGWGKDGRDEAVLFITREPADNLKWHGWMRVQGGFSGARLGRAQRYQNDALGFRVYLPKDSVVSTPTADEVMILAPGQGHPGQDRAAAFIFIEPANQRTVEQVVDAVKAETGPGFNITVTAMTIEDSQALVVSGLPGQDVNRQLFMVHGGQVYHMMFVPDIPNAQESNIQEAYSKMEDIYAMVVNTWHFVR
jgi:hypothetical protein